MVVAAVAAVVVVVTNTHTTFTHLTTPTTGTCIMHVATRVSWVCRPVDIVYRSVVCC